MKAVSNSSVLIALSGIGSHLYQHRTRRRQVAGGAAISAKTIWSEKRNLFDPECVYNIET